jgi:cystathionine gamma-synthase
MTAAVGRPPGIPLGSSVPPMTAHAVSVSLPTWADNVGYEEGEKRVVEKMETGYPRFFVHRTIQKVSWIAQIGSRGRADISSPLYV